MPRRRPWLCAKSGAWHDAAPAGLLRRGKSLSARVFAKAAAGKRPQAPAEAAIAAGRLLPGGGGIWGAAGVECGAAEGEQGRLLPGGAGSMGAAGVECGAAEGDRGAAAGQSWILGAGKPAPAIGRRAGLRRGKGLPADRQKGRQADRQKGGQNRYIKEGGMSSLREKIADDLKAGLKSRNKPLVKALRMLQAAIKNKEIELRPEPVRDGDILDTVKKQVKQSRESLEAYEKADYKQQAEEERYSLSALQSYLPKALSEEELQSLIQNVISELKAESLKDMGRVMKEAMVRAKGAADGKRLSGLVRERLQNPPAGG